MKIAYYEQNKYHTEIMGTFLQYFDSVGITITVYNTGDMSSTTEYFKKFSHFDVKPHKTIISDYELYDKIIIGSSSDCNDFIDDIPNLDYSKLIFVCHLKSDIKSNYQNIIVLTPLNAIPFGLTYLTLSQYSNLLQQINSHPDLNMTHFSHSPQPVYILPIHNYITAIPPREKKILTIIGRFKDANRDTNDLVNLIRNFHHLNFVINIFSRLRKFIPKILLQLSAQYPDKIKIHLKTSSDKLHEYLVESKYILPLVNKNSWYHKDRLSGNIALAYNYLVPLIMDKQLNNIYQIKNCIVYNNSLTEIIEKVCDMPELEYQHMLNGFIQEKHQIISNNNKILDEIVSQ